MDKAAIKNFSIWARNKLIADISYKAGLLGITEKEIKAPLPQSTGNVQFFNIGSKEPYSISGPEIEQRKRLTEVIADKAKYGNYAIAYKSVMEEVAYTWFNRLIAIRFMEVNDYLPTRIRVLSSESQGKLEPDLVTHPLAADLGYTPYEKDRIMQLKNENKLNELFRMLFIKQCNALNKNLPELFEKTNDYTELLFNVSFTDKDGVVYHLVNDISEDDFDVKKEGQVEIIGWLYQYYNTEPKDETFALLKKNIKITKERIPSATQLFTPHWIVRYMVENSLGRLWLESHPNDELKAKWKYYLDEAEQTPEVAEQLRVLRSQSTVKSPEDIRLIDPCMGSGHILAYAFDVLMVIYESEGYAPRDAAKLILEKNIYGLDIDRRAYQLAYFSLMMKAREYNRRILNEDIKPQVYHPAGFSEGEEYGSLVKVDEIPPKPIEEPEQLDFDDITFDLKINAWNFKRLLAQKYDIVVTNPPYMGGSGMNTKLSEFVKENYPDSKSDLFAVFIEKCGELLNPTGYQAMITQPSFLFLNSFEKLRKKIITNNMINNLLHMGRGIFGIDFGSTAFVINKNKQPKYIGVYFRLHERTFQFIDPFDIEKIFLEAKRNKKLSFDFSTYSTGNRNFLSLNETNNKTNNKITIYHEIRQENFRKIPGSPIAYWVSEELIKAFETSKLMKTLIEPKQGLATADNDRFLRLWHEIKSGKIKYDSNSIQELKNSDAKWVPYNKGGPRRQWYGNYDYVVNWENDGFEIRNFKDSRGKLRSVVRNPRYHFKEAITWSLITSGGFSIRYRNYGSIHDVSGMSAFSNDHNRLIYILGLMSTKISNYIFKMLNPTINLQIGDFNNFPILFNENIEIIKLVNQSIIISRADWDTFETSWDFKTSPLLADSAQRLVNSGQGKVDSSGKSLITNHYTLTTRIKDSYENYKNFTNSQFDRLKSNEEELNRIFIEIYGLQDELTPEVSDKDITIAKIFDSQDEIYDGIKGNRYILTKEDVIKQFISYAVGCMFGRYSLDIEGLAYAGGEWDADKYKTFIPNEDNIILINDEEYFNDDVVGLFVDFVKKVYGDETLEENLDFIAQALNVRGNSPREIICNYIIKDFFKDHCKTYKKRPIYWLFDSGKQNGFKALIYMHRYDENTIGNLRIDYLHKMQRIYENEISRMQDTIDNSNNAREITAATKRKEKLIKQLQETKEYDEKIAHLALARISIDLDDGVNVNYEKVQTDREGNKYNVMAKI